MAEEDFIEVPIEQNPDAETEEVGGFQEKQPFPIYSEKDTNLVPLFESHPDGKEWLIKSGSDIIRKFDNGYTATSEYRERFADMWRIFAGELKPKTGPLKDASNAHLPVMMENLSRLVNRAYGELYGDWSNVFNYLPNGPDDDDVSNRLTLHGNWQVREQIPEFKRQMERKMLMFFGPGDVTVHTYWNNDHERPCVEVLSPDEFVTPYVQVSVSPDWSDVPWRAKILNLYRHELQAYRGVWFGVEDVLKRRSPSWDDEPHQPVTKSVSEVQGINQEDEAGAPYKVIWYEGWEDLPSQPAQRFVQAIVDYDTRKIMRLTLHERANWQDQVRFDRQLQEFNQYQQAVAASQAAQEQFQQMEQQFQMQVTMQAIGPEAVNQLGPELEAQRAAIPPMPPPPDWLTGEMEGPEPAKMEPISLFSHGVCLEPMVGNLGYGYGRVQSDLNKAANVLFQHFTDGASLAAGRTIITGENVDFRDGFKVGPAVHLKMTGVTGDEIAKEFVEFKFQPPEPALMQGVDKLIQLAESSIQAPGILSGEAGKSGETYRGVSARIEQATKNLAVSTRKCGNVLEQIIKHLAYLNSVFLRDEEIFLVTNHLGETAEAKVGRKMYERGYRVTLRADLRFATLAQRIAESDELVQMAQTNPLLAQNLAFQWQALKKALEARGRHDMIPSLGPEPPPPQTPFGLPPPAPPPPIDPATGQPFQEVPPGAAPPQPVLQ